MNNPAQQANDSERVMEQTEHLAVAFIILPLIAAFTMSAIGTLN